jgi:hypothetical protein
VSLADIVRSAVAIAQSVTEAGELQETVTLRRWKSADASGAPTYATSLQASALVSHSAVKLRTDTGIETVSTAQVTFLQPIDPLAPVVSGREEPIDKRDQIILTNGKSGPILRTDGGLADPDTGRPYTVTAYLG